MYWPPFHPSLLHLAQPCGPSNSCATQHWTDQWSIHSIHQQTYSIALTVTSPLKWLPDCCWVDTVLHTSAIEYASFIIKGNKVHKNRNSQGSRRFTRVLFVCHLSMMIRVTVMSMSSPLDTLASTLFPAWQDLNTKFLIFGNFCRLQKHCNFGLLWVYSVEANDLTQLPRPEMHPHQVTLRSLPAAHSWAAKDRVPAVQKSKSKIAALCSLCSLCPFPSLAKKTFRTALSIWHSPGDHF